MGLSISTGGGDDDLECINEVLEANDIAPFVERDEPGTARARPNCDSFPYSFIHYLRRAYALVREEEALTPVEDGADPTEEPAIEEVAAMLDSHLICHSDADGYYVPIEFDEVIADTEDVGLPGGVLGSSIRLMAELVEVAPALAIKLDRTGALSDEVAAILANEAEDSTPFWRERLVWLALFEAARVSIANHTLIRFH